MQGHRRIFVALDTPDADHARRLIRTLSGHVGGFKIGLELFTSCGPDIVRETVAGGAEVFLDLKLHDIPNTVAGAAAAAARLGVSFFTVHAGGGSAMIRHAVDGAGSAAAATGHTAPCVLAVTVLTSLDDAALDEVGMAGPCSTAVERLAGVARDAGAGGLVCSPLEVARARQLFPGAELVVPGIRPASASRDDQARTATPAAAVAAGADRLVLGRPIVRADDPVAAAKAIGDEIPSPC